MPGDAVDISDALEQLVNQFSERLSFFRELVQNSIDAGTSEIEIRTEWSKGMATIHVEDFGAGMDRQVIDSKLTRLFSSGKDGDMTKIGRFGIGFVSVFAIQPEAVCVDTSRAGENWRVLFRADRSFRRIALDHPVDGTKIRIFKRMKKAEFTQLVKRSKETVAYWCRHVPVDLYFDGDRLNAPFELPGPCTVHIEEGDTEVVASYTSVAHGTFGFYNAGLTLFEGAGEFFPGVAFKASSRKLEHTMTRDNVIRDDAFERVMAVVERAHRQLQRRLLEMLEGYAEQDSPADGAQELYAVMQREAFPTHELEPGELARQIFRDVRGKTHSLADLRRERDRGLFAESEPTALGLALAEMGPVVLPNGPAAQSAGQWLDLEPLDPRTAYCLAVPTEEGFGDAWVETREIVRALVEAELRGKISDIVLAHLGRDASGVAHRSVALVRAVDKVERLDDALKLSTGLLARSRVLVFGVDHPTVRRALALAESAPAFAGYVLTRLVALACDAPLDEAALCRTALETRWQRSTN